MMISAGWPGLIRKALSALILTLVAALWTGSVSAADDPRAEADFLCTSRMQARYASRCQQDGPGAVAASMAVE
ncbi:MAG: hypothetical protein WBR18_11910, partial [Anaerolineales bacterium]